ncbi:MAG: hypothetical protein UY48_C0005G0055 [Candidatus Gottesmanbacteria bacterium GW2011_GWB1_49_7]|uniref:Uncharacterized protein n=1 Tax=Candidatus Gottesmanbacteria bacterium GW2011_GWB1_49_7 TaxID=1618448 RepID=A0A0G1Z2W9_9BACT|nr:MAG: hypothetical protein UY48_C0005G0055 [Candidatus Gottesmanbacteria bacterium GW2011_GWB1_49_7]
MQVYINPDGTFNLLKLTADVSGLSEAEILWVIQRAEQLEGEGLSKERAKEIILKEREERPWENLRS